MRRCLALLFFLALAIASAAGQDIILTRTAEEIKAKVITITDDAITYQLQGQTVNRVMPRTDIFMIKYANGEKEVFNTNERITSNTRTTDKPRASRSYQLLDLYDENGVRGIVVDVYDDGYHGTIMSLGQRRLPFMKYFESFASTAMGLYNSDNGMENQKELLAYLSQSELLSIEDFPAMNWCISLGEGWYLPARNEMDKIFAHIAWDKGIDLNTLNQMITSYKGTKLGTEYSYITSTESRNQGSRVNVILMSSYFIKYSDSAWFLWRWTPAFVRAFYQF